MRTEIKKNDAFVAELEKTIAEHADTALNQLNAAIESGDQRSAALSYYVHHPLLDQEQERKLIKIMKKGQEAGGIFEERAIRARNALIACNGLLVVSIALKYEGRGITLSELLQEGTIGLMKSLEKFDLNENVRLSTYAVYWIRQKIGRAIVEQGQLIKMPRQAKKDLYEFRQTIRNLELKLGRYPKNNEIAKELRISPYNVRKLHLRNKLTDVKSLNEEFQVGDEVEDKLPLSEFVGVEPDYSKNIMDDSLRQSIDLALKEKRKNGADLFTKREKTIIRARFGLDDGQSKTLEDLAQFFGVTKERIRQIEGNVLRKLRNCLNSNRLRRYHLNQ